MTLRLPLLLIACSLFFTTLGCAQASGDPSASIHPARLRCEYRVDPLGIDVVRPQLDWIVQPADPKARGLSQSAYRILVASSLEQLAQNQGDLWDSGKVESSQTQAVPYGGKSLSSHQTVWWAVQTWDQKGAASPWSPPAQWSMGILRPDDWGPATWIRAPGNWKDGDNSTGVFRREFTLKAGLKRAVVAICGLGQYEMSLNGRLVTEDRLTPGWTEYNKTCLYDSYDITGWLREGKNAVGLLLGNGMYRVGKERYSKFQKSFGPLQAIAQFRFEYNDGSVETVGSDRAWRVGVSPMTFSNVYGGEDWDARKVQAGWDQPGFDDAHWLAVEPSPGPGGTLQGTPRSAPPVRTYESHAAVGHHELKPNVMIYDLGQAASHLTRFTVHGPAGSSLRITPSELLNPDGSLFVNNYNGKAWSHYTLAGTGPETYTSKFYYGGNRYLKVECIPAADGGAAPVVDSIEGVVLHSSVTPTGAFSCSNELFNRIYAMIRVAELSNMMSVISDCPHRERLGWLEQDHLHGPSFRYNYEMSPFVAKILGDIGDCQLTNGMIPTHVPEYPIFPPKWRDAIEWGSSGIQLPWQHYQWTGEVEVLRRNYPMMKRYLSYLKSRDKGRIAASGLGDWTGQRASDQTPKELIATALYYDNARVLAQTAKLLGQVDDAAEFEKLATEIREAFNATFFHPEQNQYGSGSQGAQALALAIDLVAPTARSAVLAQLVTDLENRHHAMTVGEVGLPYLLRALATEGRSDLIYAINNQTEHPGYGYQLSKGATALCETWDAARDNSQIQFMLGHIIEWFYHDLAGIQLDPQAPGFRHFIIRPAFVADLTEVRGSYDSVQGKIISEWRRDSGGLLLDVRVPPNTTATIVLPTSDAKSVTESQSPIAEVPAITEIRSEGTSTWIYVGSGEYHFRLPVR